MELYALKKKLVALSVILLLVLSSISIPNSYSGSLDATLPGQDYVPIPKETGNYFAKEPIHHQITLADGISSNDKNSPSEENQLKQGELSRHVLVLLSDGVSSSSHFPNDSKKVLLAKQSSDRKAIMEKIFYADRIRLNERPLSSINQQFLINSQGIFEDPVTFDDFTGAQLVFIDDKTAEKATEENLHYLPALQTLNGLVLEFRNTQTDFDVSSGYAKTSLDLIHRILDSPMEIIFLEIEGGAAESFVATFEIIGDVVYSEVFGFVDVKNPTVLLLLVPLAGFIFIRSEVNKFEFYNYKRILSLFLIVILLSSVITIPGYSSINYLVMASASNSTDNNATSTEPEPVVEPEPVDTNATSTEPVDTNATSTEPVDTNATSTDTNATSTTYENATSTTYENATSTDTNATSTTYENATSTTYENATSTTYENATSTTYENATSTTYENATSTDTNATSTTYENATSTTYENATSTDTNATSTEPVDTNATSTTYENATSTESDYSITIDPIIIPNATSSTNGTITVDDNNDYVILPDQSYNNETGAITISALVIPDFTQGSPEFTILGKENSFVLSVNKLIEPKQVPTLSVFDGISWIKITGTMQLGQTTPTHIAGVIDGNSTHLYVNGTKDGTATLLNSVTFPEGMLELTTPEVMTSDSQLVIGAYMSTTRGEVKLSNYFSGKIEDIAIYKEAFDDAQIQKTFEDSILAYYDSLVHDITESANVTSAPVELIADPTLTSSKETYLITEDAQFELEFYSEYDVLMNELAELESALALINDVEQTLNETEATISGDVTTTVANFILPIIEFFLPAVDAQLPNDDTAVLNDIQSLKAEIQSLKDKIIQIKSGGEINKEDLKDAKKQLRDIIKNIKGLSKDISKSEKTQSKKLKDSADVIEETGDADPENVPQSGIWIGNEEIIKTDVYDSNGNRVSISVEHEKLRDGKFNIKLLFDQNDTPGLYKIKTTLIVNGETHVIEGEFAWGLVSLNTKKSIYKPGETAEFVIVVLDSEGHPVCDANLSMNITNPNLQITSLSSGNGITPNVECGLYDAEYVTTLEGTHNVDINAVANEINTNFNTTFDVAEFFEFDIIRTAQSKIDPITNPNSFDVRIDIESFVLGNNITIQESVPAVFEVVTNASVQTVGDQKILTWNAQPGENRTVEYSYSVPLEFPKLYALVWQYYIIIVIINSYCTIG